jgi:hypothetical protein
MSTGNRLVHATHVLVHEKNYYIVSHIELLSSSIQSRPFLMSLESFWLWLYFATTLVNEGATQCF